jgi:hypothetical protein
VPSQFCLHLTEHSLQSFLKQLSMDALALTSASHPQAPATLSLSSITSLFSVTPSSLPFPSAAAAQLFLRGAEPNPVDVTRLRIQESVNMGLDAELAQYWALLNRRSGVREYLEGSQ